MTNKKESFQSDKAVELDLLTLVKEAEAEFTEIAYPIYLKKEYKKETPKEENIEKKLDEIIQFYKKLR